MTLEYNRGFVGMTEDPVSLKELIEEREILITEAVGGMPAKHKEFLIGFERGKPDWSLIGLPDAARLPAIKFRQQNLDKLSEDKRAELVSMLEKVLSQ
jgi:hypothetical protein